MITALKIKLCLEGPILTGATAPGAWGIDTPFARNRDDKLYIPGTLIKGKLRQAWIELAGWSEDLPAPAEIAKWLGRKAGNSADLDSSFDPARGIAYFSDFVDHASAGKSALRTRIRMDEDRGAGDDGMLQLLESPYGAGEKATFEGTIHFFAPNSREQDRFAKAVGLGLSAVPSLGAERGIGFGRLYSINVTNQEQPDGAQAHTLSSPSPESIGMIMETTDLLCFAKPQPATNLFQSSDLIGGSVIKGSLAQMKENLGGVASFPLVDRYLSRIRIRHARPTKVGDPVEVPPAIPLSIVFAGDWKDALFCERPQLIDGIAPAFQPDWKGQEFDVAGSFFGSSSVNKELRVRTAIDAGKRRSLDENLFAYESLVPDGYRWLTVLDLSNVPETARGPLTEELKTLLSHGLFGVGKTKARMNVRFTESIPPKFASTDEAAGGVVAIQLQTPAFLGLPADWRNARSAAAVKELYGHVWSELSSGSLELSHYFARQEFAGGSYLHRRFHAKDTQYEPWLLTCAGSVFVLKVIDRQTFAARCNEWSDSGLPIAKSISDHYQWGGDKYTYWKLCPYVPENGFGEVGLNLHLNWAERLLEVQHA